MAQSACVTNTQSTLKRLSFDSPHKRKHFCGRLLSQITCSASTPRKSRGENFFQRFRHTEKERRIPTARRVPGDLTSTKQRASLHLESVSFEQTTRRGSFASSALPVQLLLCCRESANVWLIPAATANPRSYTHPQVSRDVTRGGYKRGEEGKRREEDIRKRAAESKRIEEVGKKRRR